MLAALVGVAVLAGCGDDDEEPTQQPGSSQTAPDKPSAAETGPEVATETGPGGDASTSPEESQEGGAGDEEEARSEAVFTCKGDTVEPARIEVPAYIAVKVRLEGSGCRLSIGGQELRPGDSHDLDGLPPQDRYRGTSGGKDVEIVPTGEGGP